jgi:ParB family transcriptional regulator, chromosome partitioning protein
MKKPLLWFKPDPNQPRKTFSDNELRQLGESMKAHGQLQPVGARADGTMLWGERRRRAAPFGGLTELEVIITDRKLSDSEVKVIQLVENVHRVELLGYEKWVAGTELLAMNPGWQLKDLAECLKLDPSMVTRLMSPSKCIAAWQEALKAGKVGISDCYAASRLPEAEQPWLLALKLSGASRDSLEREAKKRRNGPSVVKMDRVKIPLPNNMCIVVTGDSLDMAAVANVLGEVSKECRKAADTFDVKTWQSMMRDRSKARAS